MAVKEVNVIWLSYTDAPENGYWCYGWLEEIFPLQYGPNDIWPPDITFYKGLQISDVPEGEGAIVVLKAEDSGPYVQRLNAELATLPWFVLILASDEGGLFPIAELDHDLMVKPTSKLWVMTPHFEKHVYPEGTQFLGEGYPQDARKHIAANKYVARDRSHVLSFSGQITHERRYEMVEALEEEGFYINKTPGFTQGLGREDYYELLADTIVTPAPSGPVTLDSFRAFEALESGGVPILDLTCSVEQDGHLYWNSILGEDHPLPTVFDWHQALPWIDDTAFNWPLSGNLVFSWWQMHKRELRYRILEGVPGITHGDITILIPTSVIPTHPSTLLLDQTIESVRFHFPTADILVMCDGIRPEQEDRRYDYDRYVQEVCWKANFEWTNVYPIVFSGFEHQANMTRAALDLVRTPLVMFVEHDTPLVIDEPFDWPRLLDLANSDDVDVIRFHFEAHVHPEHERLMTDPDVIDMRGVPVRHTRQWSQRPHIAKRSYYQWLIHSFFPVTGRTMIEDRLHSMAQNEEYFDQFRIVIYCPPGGNIKRSLHTDGRGHDPKFDMVYQ